VFVVLLVLVLSELVELLVLLPHDSTVSDKAQLSAKKPVCLNANFMVVVLVKRLKK